MFKGPQNYDSDKRQHAFFEIQDVFTQPIPFYGPHGPAWRISRGATFPAIFPRVARWLAA
jgi:hypothetical protein